MAKTLSDKDKTIINEAEASRREEARIEQRKATRPITPAQRLLDEAFERAVARSTSGAWPTKQKPT
jgi:hypothetical protein